VDSNGRGELGAIERLGRLLPAAPTGQTWIGDDAAVVAPPGGSLLLAADAVVAGVHADLSLVGLDDLGWKAIAVNVSDLAAMGGLPCHCLVTVCGPPATDLSLLYRGVIEATETYGCAVVGGDLSNADVLVVSVAVTGTVEEGRAVLRSGAQPGDTVFVTGSLGWSALGLRVLQAGNGGEYPRAVMAHRRPRAEVQAGAAARVGGATAMIDVSDGLATDLTHIARASGVGISLDTVPTAEGATLEEALHGGEDYRLAFTAPAPDSVEEAFARLGVTAPITIGHCTPDSGTLFLGGEPVPALGWEHRWA